MKKALKIIGIIILIVFLLLLAIPFAFQSQIKDLVKQSINNKVNAKVEFADLSLSLLKSFPEAHVEVSDLVITNYKPFEGETLATVSSLAFTMSVKELFKSSEDTPIEVHSIQIEEASLTLITDTLGNSNYDISKDDPDTSAETTDSNGFSFDIQAYAIENSAITYIDEGSSTELFLSEFNHTGKGIFSAETSELDTETSSAVTLKMDSITYLNNNSLKLEAIIGMELDKQKYTFKQNKAYINQLPIEFDGHVELFDEGPNVDIHFVNPESSFKNFLALVPEVYSKNIGTVETSGDFKVEGFIKGMITEFSIPKMDITINSNNASFKYPDLPKKVENININTSIKNDTGNPHDTYVSIDALHFKIDNDEFRSSARIDDLTGNMRINADIDGSLNLGNITKAYPIELDKQLSGILEMQLNTKFDMDAIESNAYERIKNKGTANISDFIFSSEDIVNPIQINAAKMTFNPGLVRLEQFDAQTGESDFKANGTITNLLGFLLSDKNLQGTFNVNSNTFVVSDFMIEDEDAIKGSNKTSSGEESLKIPAFLDCKIFANAKSVLYDNLNLTDVKGTVIIKDQKAELQRMVSTLFEGQLAISGMVDTQTETPTFNLDLLADGFDIAQSFNGLELLQNLAPIAKAMQGELNTSLQLQGTLDNEFSPNLNTLSGRALAELMTTKIDPKEGSVLNRLDGALGIVDFSKLNLKDLKANLSFSNGKVDVKPFDLAYDDIAIKVSGSHGFDKSLDYKAVFDVPAKYLGSDVNRLIGKINNDEVKNISIPVTANITGSYNQPQVKTDLASGVSNLTNQLIEIEKQKLINKGTDQITNVIGGLLGEKDKANATDSTKTDPVKSGVKSILGGLLGGKKKEKDSTKNN